jgi:DNA anti-recombination protein RmuC
MGLGGTAKKLQKVVDVADELYVKINDLREDLNKVRNSIDETNERVGKMESQLAHQRELLEQIAEAEGVETASEAEAEPTEEPDTTAEATE